MDNIIEKCYNKSMEPLKSAGLNVSAIVTSKRLDDDYQALVNLGPNSILGKYSYPEEHEKREKLNKIRLEETEREATKQADISRAQIVARKVEVQAGVEKLANETVKMIGLTKNMFQPMGRVAVDPTTPPHL